MGVLSDATTKSWVPSFALRPFSRLFSFSSSKHQYRYPHPPTPKLIRVSYTWLLLHRLLLMIVGPFRMKVMRACRVGCKWSSPSFLGLLFCSLGKLKRVFFFFFWAFMQDWGVIWVLFRSTLLSLTRTKTGPSTHGRLTEVFLPFPFTKNSVENFCFSLWKDSHGSFYFCNRLPRNWVWYFLVRRQCLFD